MVKRSKSDGTMREWMVSLPFTGFICVPVQAVDEQSAIDAAFDAVPDDWEKEIVEMQFHQHVTQGNMCSAVLNDAEAEPSE